MMKNIEKIKEDEKMKYDKNMKNKIYKNMISMRIDD